MGIKISIIGAGSSVFSLSLIRDLCTSKNLSGCRVSMMDIDEERLDNAFRLCTRYAAEVGSGIAISKTTNRIESLSGADFVINTALHVRYDLWKRGWSIAQGLGYRYGGSLHIMHDEAFWINFYQFALMESIYQDMQKVCPDAWYLLVANPVLAGITWLKRLHPDSKIVGLCHGYGGIYALADQLGLEREKIRYEVSGVNHLIWLTHFSYEGKDAFPLLDKWIAEKSEDYFENGCGLSSQTGPKAVDLYRRFGVYPIGDTGSPGGGAWGWWYHSDDATERRWKDDPAWWFREIYFEANEKIVERISKTANDPSARVSEIFPPLKESAEPMVPLIESLAFDIPRVMIVNIQNDGEYVPGLPKDFEVEIPALVSGSGVQGIRCKPLPKPVIAHILRDRIAPVEVELTAYTEGDYDMLLSLVLMDPWTKSEKQARSLLENILNQPELSQMKEHYRIKK
ncbi:alpha-glucosidase [Spirochaetia bacterium]|nr:alpha-glucosidase [Spirochaetia bacterium]